MVHEYSVFIISGFDGKNFINGTWVATFDFIPNEIPTNETKWTPKWTFIEGFPKIGRQNSACFINDRNSISIVGGKM